MAVTAHLVEVDGVVGVQEGGRDWAPGEEGGRPEEHRGGAAGAGSHEERRENKMSPIVLHWSSPCWFLHRPESRTS